MLETQTTSTPEGSSSSSQELSVSFSKEAVDAIASQIKKRGVPDTSLRVGIRGGGCSGFSYVVEFHDGLPHKRDKVYDLVSGAGVPVRVVIDPKSLIYLNGSTLMFEKTLLRQGFKWENPQEKTSCGCGHSFTV